MKVALVGDGVGQSLTPQMHEAEGAAQGLTYRYEIWDTSLDPWRGMDLPSILDHAERAGLAGLNITHPHKMAVVACLDELVGPARDLRTVNTVAFRDGARIGFTTDYTGFLRAMRSEGLPLTNARVVQFGAGGAGAATALALLDLGAALTIVDADAARARALAERLRRVRPDAAVSSATIAQAQLSAAAGVVNATPVGMAAHPGSPFDPGDAPGEAWIADIIYFPRETALMRQARALGMRVIGGGGMAVFQAADAFECFTGLIADVSRLQNTFSRLTLGAPFEDAS